MISQPIGVNMDIDKVDVSIKKIDNGYLICRSWHEKKKDGDMKDSCMSTEPKSEEHFVKELPEGFSKYMVKGSIGDDEVKTFNDADDRAMSRINRSSEKEEKKEEDKE